MVRLNFKNEVDCGVEETLFRDLSDKACVEFEDVLREIVGECDSEIGLFLVNDEKIRELNRKWRGVDKATDVLSFAYLEEEGPGVGDLVVGDVFISVETAEVQAREKKHDLQSELRILFVHGVLHLFGFEHGNDEEEEEMEELSGKILE